MLIWWYTRSQSKKRQLRLEYLRNKYKDDALVQKIVAGYFWKGQTANQLIDSLGQPADVDQKVLKSMKREIWKYRPQSRTRYGLRITLENDVVVGWDQKD
ncbi:MAG: DUF2845 domain-containing protein [Nitrospirae bacterium]|nr:MAG: DUF2845 domain-containing protein [Nitrospirota bacterium]